MRGNNVLGIIFSNMHDESIRELTDFRTMGSVPFGGRYRLIDFPLSNMANSGVTKVGDYHEKQLSFFNGPFRVWKIMGLIAKTRGANLTASIWQR